MNNNYKPCSKFKLFLVENNIKQYEVSELLGKTASTINQKINGTGTKFTFEDIKTICNHYNLSPDEYFFK